MAKALLEARLTALQNEPPRPAAARILAGLDSAGTSAKPGSPATSEACQVMDEHGVSLATHRSKPVTEELVRSAALILTMTDSHAQTLSNRFPAAQDRIVTLGEYAGLEGSITDPIGQGIDVYRECAESLGRLIDQGLPKLLDAAR